eukprot:476204-Lingulodinium_polyedra.AAC.1
MVAPKQRLEDLAKDMGRTLLLRGVAFLDKHGDDVQFLGRVIRKQLGGFDVAVNRALVGDIVGEAGLESP